MATSFDPQALKFASQEFEEQQANAKRRREEELRRRRLGKSAAWDFADEILKMNHAAHEIQFGADFVPAAFVKSVLSAFWVVCEVMREQGFNKQLDFLDDERMVEVHGSDRAPQLATLGYEQAVVLLRECTSLRFKRTEALERQLRSTFSHSAGRHIWYMMCPVVKGFLTEQGRIFLKAKGKKAHRNYQWWTWEQEGMKPAQIRDRWNRDHADEAIGMKERGRDIVRKALKAIKARRPHVP